jgi:GntR family transcriptional repressor for pyruvate dehydrogenase complex
MGLKPITRTRLSEAAIEQIKELIVSKNLEPGAQLPSERELVTVLGISRASIREALRMLEIMGLVSVQPGRGVFVKALSGDLFMPLSSLLSTHKETLQHHFEARLILEPEAAAFAARRANGNDIRRLEKVLATFQENLDADNLVALIRADILFHRLIARATHNRTFEILMNTITRHDFIGWKMSLRTKKRPVNTVKEHGKIFEAILAKDEKKAKSAMRSHLKAAIRKLRQAGFE